MPRYGGALFFLIIEKWLIKRTGMFQVTDCQDMDAIGCLGESLEKDLYVSFLKRPACCHFD